MQDGNMARQPVTGKMERKKRGGKRTEERAEFVVPEVLPPADATEQLRRARRLLEIIYEMFCGAAGGRA